MSVPCFSALAVSVLQAGREVVQILGPLFGAVFWARNAGLPKAWQRERVPFSGPRKRTVFERSFAVPGNRFLTLRRLVRCVSGCSSQGIAFHLGARCSLVSDQGRSLKPVPALPVVRFSRISVIMADLAFSAGAAGESAAVAQVPVRSRQDRRRAAVDVAAGCLTFVLTSRVAAAFGAMVQLLRNLGSSQRAFWLGGLIFAAVLGRRPGGPILGSDFRPRKRAFKFASNCQGSHFVRRILDQIPGLFWGPEKAPKFEFLVGLSWAGGGRFSSHGAATEATTLSFGVISSRLRGLRMPLGVRQSRSASILKFG